MTRQIIVFMHMDDENPVEAPAAPVEMMESIVQVESDAAPVESGKDVIGDDSAVPHLVNLLE